MVYIPFPRIDHDDDPALVAWRGTPVNGRDWATLKPYLAKAPRLRADTHPIPKCWYSELPQGDNYALDVEHFRPKGKASPLNAKQVLKLKKITGFNFQQANIIGEYPWLEFDYRNYRLVTALPNRGGAKHHYFPIANATRLEVDATPWGLQQNPEYPYFLDPTNPDDANLLLVKPNGEIIPRAPKSEPTLEDFTNLSNSWHAGRFDYLRAQITILMYRLNDKVFQQGRKEVYDKVVELMDRLQYCLPDDADRLVRLKDGFIADLVLAISPSAPFALAARSALEAYIAPIELSDDLRNALEGIARQILDRVNLEVSGKIVDWSKP